MRKLAALALLTTWTGACATAPSSNVCPREVDYTADQQRQAAEELAALPKAGIVRGTMMPDYARLRDQVRACRAAAH